MEINNYFTFTLNVSSEGYEKKTDAIACLSSKGAEAIGRKKMCFFEETVSVDEFLDLAQSGHSFCALYRFEEGKKYWYSNKKGQKYCGYPYYQRDSKTATKGGLKIDFKRDEYFYGSQVIFIDIDDTKYTDINEYISLLTFKPTMVYMSYSDGKEKGGKVSRRFHLCYVFDSILDSDYFKYCSSTLSEALVRDTNEELEDKCGEKMSQYMNGCFGNSENYKTYHIYTINDIEIYKEIIEEEKNIEVEENKTTTYYSDCEKNGQPNSEVEEALYIETTDDIEDAEEICTPSFVNDMERLSYDEFMYYNRHKYNYFYRMENNDWITVSDGDSSFQYQYIDENYFALYYNVNKVKDGSERRKKLYQRMCLRRVINPNVDADTLLFNAYEDLNRYFDNSGENGANIITVDELVKNVEWAMSKTIDEIEEDFSDTLEYLRSKAPKRGIIYKFPPKVFRKFDEETEKYKNRNNMTLVNSAIKDVIWGLIGEYYDLNLSVKENLSLLKENNINVSERTLYRFCKENGINTKGEKENIDSQMMEEYNFSLSIRENLEILKNKGYKISRGKLANLVKEYNSNKEDNNSSSNSNIIINVEDNTNKSTTYYNGCENFGHQENEVEVYSDYQDWVSSLKPIVFDNVYEHQESKVEVYSDYDDWFSRMDRLRDSLKVSSF